MKMETTLSLQVLEFQSPHSLDHALIPCLIISDDSNGNEEKFLCKKCVF
jgi:hypothetical protein